MNTQAKTTLLRNWYEDVWATENLDAIPQYMADDGLAVGLFPDMAVSPGDMRDLISMVRT